MGVVVIVGLRKLAMRRVTSVTSLTSSLERRLRFAGEGVAEQGVEHRIDLDLQALFARVFPRREKDGHGPASLHLDRLLYDRHVFKCLDDFLK